MKWRGGRGVAGIFTQTNTRTQNRNLKHRRVFERSKVRPDQDQTLGVLVRLVRSGRHSETEETKARGETSKIPNSNSK